ncbi:hypothetical protein [Sphingomonas sp. Y38-1Y]|jgi:hypothetical protein|uniref:hypothetical protein n=1 Tax=Sphingomonas sp. Y38-1Y TaxID=3078265 RepID=UPI0028EF5841|nr:hypothetical protein [Sphingomonas sp. Y38-1Y]
MSMLLIAAALLAPQTAPVDAAAPPAKERRICRKLVDTGSLVKGKRECRTAAEWNNLANAARLGSEDIIQRNAGGFVTN